MKANEVMANVGKKATLTLKGEFINGTWEVELLGVSGSKAVVKWQKPALPAGERNGRTWAARPADKAPTKHQVSLGALSIKEADTKPKQKVAEPKGKKAVIDPVVKSALEILKAYGYNVTLN